MEYLSKREFYKKYATKKDKSNIKSAAIFTYICAGKSPNPKLTPAQI